MCLRRCLFALATILTMTGSALAGAGGGDAPKRYGKAVIGGNEALISALNRARTESGLRAVQVHPQLTAAAQRHADDMRARGFFAHKAPGGGTHKSRMRKAGYRACTSGEALAMGVPNEQSAFVGWMNSPGHYKVLMGRKFTHYGFARSGNHWVFVAGRPC